MRFFFVTVYLKAAGTLSGQGCQLHIMENSPICKFQNYPQNDSAIYLLSHVLFYSVWLCVPFVKICRRLARANRVGDGVHCKNNNLNINWLNIYLFVYVKNNVFFLSRKWMRLNKLWICKITFSAKYRTDKMFIMSNSLSVNTNSDT